MHSYCLPAIACALSREIQNWQTCLKSTQWNENRISDKWVLAHGRIRGGRSLWAGVAAEASWTRQNMNWIWSSLGILRQHGDGQCVCHTVKNKCGIQNWLVSWRKGQKLTKQSLGRHCPFLQAERTEREAVVHFFIETIFVKHLLCAQDPLVSRNRCIPMEV